MLQGFKWFVLIFLCPYILRLVISDCRHLRIDDDILSGKFQDCFIFIVLSCLGHMQDIPLNGSMPLFAYVADCFVD